MANAYKTLGNANPGSTLSTLYTVPPATQTIAKFVACNRASVPKTFRMAVSPLGAAPADDHYWYYDTQLPANDTLEIDGISMEATDVLRVYGEDTNVSFNLNGVELT